MIKFNGGAHSNVVFGCTLRSKKEESFTFCLFYLLVMLLRKQEGKERYLSHFSPLLHPPHSYFTLLVKQRICFSDVGINFPVYGTTVTPYEEPTATPPPTTTTSITPYVTDEDPEDTTLTPTPGKLDPIAGKRDNMVQKVQLVMLKSLSNIFRAYPDF